MRHIAHISRCVTAAAAAAGCLWLAGCATSREPQYYLLAGAGPSAAGPAEALPAPEQVVYILPVRMPAYLDRPQIVTRPSPWEIQTSDFHRWGMPLEGAVANRLTAVLARELPGAAITVLPPAGPAAGAGIRRVQLEIDSLEGVLGGEVVLTARWTITGAPAPGMEARAELRRAGEIRQAAAGPGYAGYVQSISAAVDELGRRLAASLREF